MTHANAPLTPEGRRRLARLVVEESWPVRRVAERFQVSPATPIRWVGRYRAGQPMEDHSCRPHHSPGRLARRTERRIIALRLNRQWGPHRIAYHLGLARSTVGRVLTRYNMPRLTEVDQATGLAVLRPARVRYEKTSPGELVHLDINKLGHVPDGGGWRAHGRGTAPALAADRAKTRTRRRGSPVGGYRYIHHAIDDYSRVVYSEILDDDRKQTAAGFFQRANAFFKDLGITFQAVMTDNGACYRSRAFNQSCPQPASSTATPAPTGPIPTARSSASTALWPASGPTPTPTPTRPSANPPTKPGSTTTTTTDPTPPWTAKPPPTAFTTSQGSAPRRENSSSQDALGNTD